MVTVLVDQYVIDSVYRNFHKYKCDVATNVYPDHFTRGCQLKL